MDALTFIPAFYDKFIVFMLIFARISTLLMALTIFRKEMFATRVIVAFSVILSLYVLFNNPIKQMSNELYSVQTIYSIFFQILIGLTSAIIVNVIIEVFLYMGQVISTQVGMNIISVLDPSIGMITALSQFYVNTSILIFFMLNGHLFVIKTIVDSFNYLSIYHVFSPFHLFHDILGYAGIIFSGSLLISMTIIVTMMLTNISLAAMTKFAPQFNIFSIGIIILLVIGLIAVYFNFNYFVNDAIKLINDGLHFFSNKLLSLGA